MTTHYDVAVIGAGIVGLSHAWMASRRGLRVLLIERTAIAQGASVRNFGMIWPIGQPAGVLTEAAHDARRLWLELRSLDVVGVEECGSLHLAHRSDELAVLEEFESLGTHPVELLSPNEVVKQSPLANPQGLLGGMWSHAELRVNPRTASARLAKWLGSRSEVECQFNTLVTRIDSNELQAAGGRRWSADRILVCSGSDLQTLYADEFASSGLRLCKLQMLKSVPQAGLPPATPHIASGLTLRHYDSFRSCTSLEALRSRIAEETPELDQYGIHLMASAFPSGEVILGDSHEYGEAITPFDKSEIDELMLRELRKLIRLTDWSIAERWHGIYAKHASLPVFEHQVSEGVHLFVGPGGAGMTLSLGLAKQAWERWTGEAE